MSRRQRREQQRRRRRARRPRAAHTRLATGAGISLAAALGAPAAAQATDFTVTTTADPAPGTCALGDCSLREAVEAAEGNATDDRILFQAGLTGTIALGGGQGHLYVDEPLEVLGPGAAALTVSGENTSRIFSIFTGVADPVTISGLTLSGGHADPGNGGAILSYFAELAIHDSTISGSDADTGGGGVSSYQGTTTIEGSTISGNDAPFGGGVLSSEGTVTIQRSTLSGNGSTNGGGAVNSFESTTMIEDSTISGNEADFGAGVYATTSALTIERSTIAGNEGHSGGGGVWSQLQYSDDQILNNTIVAGNTAVTGPDLFRTTAGGFNAAFSLIGSTAGVTLDETVPGSNITDQSPELGPLADNGGPTATRMPAITSPAVDRGSAPGPTDQRGLTRPVDLPGIPNSAAAGANGADIGAVELRLPSNAFTLGALKRNRRKGTATLAVTVPGAGRLVLGGAKVRGATKNPTGAGIVKLLIRAKGRAKRRLRNLGKARVRAAVTFTPTAGNPRTESRRVRLVKRMPR